VNDIKFFSGSGEIETLDRNE